MVTTTASTDKLTALGLSNTAKSTSDKNASTGALGQADFLKLMTEQLKNQDPLKPLDSQQFLGQLAQFSTVQGIEGMQTAMGSMASVMESDQTLRAASLVGHDAMVTASSVAHTAGTTLDGEITAATAGPVTLQVTDANGNVVRTLQVEAAASGATAFHWDGLTDSGTAAGTGTYTLKAVTGSVAAADMKSATALDIGVMAHVDSVSIESTGLTLNLAGVGGFPLSSIRRVS
ncbi:MULTISPECIES: flagellar hook capping FlgD N-terminal domain-containing protein [Pseudoxanthomonas]|uniref:Basal-body rod modification protein FlgD n=1 Tax=Pseudoxanthomonas winnipegensis TaxID=2480810 RepID=A0AAW8GCM3_9GAMM|nr:MULTISPECIES: flagellar hook capping FlgD N-terminal domain-containing protein [Pseudoxanthomonas]MDQ1120129.1 flagellar basal-body rod modification protein FlgD [Pseudoxanthomonas winnipegensis]MDQ1133339.1 flagellar basal-body rod modification protein FlgD [Pseudoxanthomonas winnipegensis]MDR6140415.1 flagellar basal-body rod modification protein FlgD [Pseudoxanthomonas sp. SORGH_AS_0997]